MSKYLISTVETFRVDSEGEVEIMLEQAKNTNEFELKKYTSEKKEKKDRKTGEIIDSYYKVALYKAFNDEKDAYTEVNINYEVG